VVNHILWAGPYRQRILPLRRKPMALRRSRGLVFDQLLMTDPSPCKSQRPPNIAGCPGCSMFTAASTQPASPARIQLHSAPRNPSSNRRQKWSVVVSSTAIPQIDTSRASPPSCRHPIKLRRAIHHRPLRWLIAAFNALVALAGRSPRCCCGRGKESRAPPGPLLFVFFFSAGVQPRLRKAAKKTSTCSRPSRFPDPVKCDRRCLSWPGVGFLGGGARQEGSPAAYLPRRGLRLLLPQRASSPDALARSQEGRRSVPLPQIEPDPGAKRMVIRYYKRGWRGSALPLLRVFPPTNALFFFRIAARSLLQAWRGPGPCRPRSWRASLNDAPVCRAPGPERPLFAPSCRLPYPRPRTAGGASSLLGAGPQRGLRSKPFPQPELQKFLEAARKADPRRERERPTAAFRPPAGWGSRSGRPVP